MTNQPKPQNEEQLQHLTNHLEDVIEKKVNGKIDRLTENIQPILDAYSTANNTGKFIVWLGKITMYIGIIIGGIMAFTKFLK